MSTSYNGEICMVEDKNMRGPKKCHNCGSVNIIGPYDAVRSFFALFNSVVHQAYICVDCFHSMFFISKEDEEKVINESQKLLDQYQ